MNPLKVWYKKPRTVHKEVSIVTTENIHRTVTIVTEDKLLDENLKIPCCAYVHPAGLQEIIKRCHKSSITIATLLISGLHTKEQNNEIVISIAELCELSGLSKPTVIAALDSLEANYFIKRICQSRYGIEPSLAWFGNQVDWAIALKEHRSINKGA
jgi:hypothetical protein